ncbi:hypothetical protein KAR91_86370 [Candidatus Pacearchaeota archaeon]|nr:hypothetical protein [Candidatus Pacearchaeota archaeon]
MDRIKLKAIKYVDFRKSEWTNYQEFKKSKKFPGELTHNEAFLFISNTGNQLIWMLNVANGPLGHRIVDSRRWRFTGTSSWNPLMLANYAEEVGIELIGIKKFQEIFAANYNKKRARRV